MDDDIVERDPEGRPEVDLTKPVIARRDGVGPGWREAIQARVLCTDRRDPSGWTAVVLVDDVRLGPPNGEVVVTYDPVRRIGASRTGNGIFWYVLENGTVDGDAGTPPISPAEGTG